MATTPQIDSAAVRLSMPQANTGMQATPSRPLVSVVILNFNYACYLKQCIESVLIQDYVPLEVIVVDDGSTDESRGVIEPYLGRLYASFKPNGGMVSSMNHGFMLSRGGIVIFVDADDYLLPGAVSAHVAALQDPQVVRSQTYLAVVHGTEPSDKERIPGNPAPEGNLSSLVMERGPGAYVSSPNSGNAWSRGFLEQVFPLPERLRAIGAETYLMDTAPLFGKIVTLQDTPRAAYRFHNANMNGQLAVMKSENIQKVLAQHEARTAWLEKVAELKGFDPQPARWKSGNWRLLTLGYLLCRLTNSPGAPSIAKLTASAFAVRGKLLKRSVLACVVLAIRFAPTPLSLRLADRFIKLRYM